MLVVEPRCVYVVLVRNVQPPVVKVFARFSTHVDKEHLYYQTAFICSQGFGVSKVRCLLHNTIVHVFLRCSVPWCTGRHIMTIYPGVLATYGPIDSIT